jgi:hypothetical protein
MSRPRVIDGKKPISATVGKTETGRPTMTVGNSEMVFVGAKGKGKNRVLRFETLASMKTPRRRA